MGLEQRSIWSGSRRHSRSYGSATSLATSVRRAEVALRPKWFAMAEARRVTSRDSCRARSVPKFGGWKLPQRAIDPWSKPGIEMQLESVDGIGLLSPQFVPYRPVGVPDLVRDRSLLPKCYRVYKGGYQETKKPTLFDVVEDEGNHVVLPLRIKGCQWNGERWCATSFSASEARGSNGSNILQSELSKSEQRLKRSRVGDYFLRETWTPPKHEKTKKKTPVPPLAVSLIPMFNESEEEAKNSALINEYRMEARRVAYEKSKGEDAQPKPGVEPTVTGMPPKALEDYSLQQLGSILGKEMKFSALQHKFNKQLYEFCDSSDTLRPFTFRRKYAALKALHDKEAAKDINPAASMDQAEVFLKGMDQHPWYKELAKLIFSGDKCGSRGEWLILNILRLAVEGGGRFSRKDFVPLLYFLDNEGVNLSEPGTVKALGLIRTALKVPNEALEEFVESCDVVPEWLLSLYHPRYGRLISFRRPTPLQLKASRYFSRFRSMQFSFV